MVQYSNCGTKIFVGKFFSDFNESRKFIPDRRDSFYLFQQCRNALGVDCAKVLPYWEYANSNVFHFVVCMHKNLQSALFYIIQSVLDTQGWNRKERGIVIILGGATFVCRWNTFFTRYVTPRVSSIRFSFRFSFFSFLLRHYDFRLHTQHSQITVHNIRLFSRMK